MEKQHQSNKILVVDDDPNLLAATARLLRLAGYQVSEASNGQIALRLAVEQQPDLILLDVTLPDMDGFQVCQRIKDEPALSGSHVVFLSGSRIDPDSQISGLEGGADDYITRPISNRELLARVQSILRIKGVEASLEERLRFERLLFKLSARFINLHVEDLDAEIQNAIEKIVEFIEVERAAIFELVGERNSLRIIYLHSMGGTPPIETQLLEKLPWYTKTLREGKVIAVGQVPNDLPPEAILEREYCSQTGLKSHIAIPLKTGGELLGVIAFSLFSRERPWPDEMVQRLSLLGEVLANALARARMEKTIRKERDFATTLLETVGALVIVLDTHGRIARFNRACEQITGYSSEEVIGRVFWDFLLIPEETGPVKKVFEQLRAGDFPNTFENYWVTKAGELRWIAWSNAAVQDETGQVEFIVGTGIDLTEHKAAEEALRENEERFRLAFEDANTGMCLVDLDGHFLRVNSQMCEIFGYSQDELESMTVNDFAHPEDLDISPRFIKQAESGEIEHNQFEKRYFHKRGYIVWGRVSSSLVRDAQGAPLYFISHVQDITEQKRAESARRESEERLRDTFEQVAIGICNSSLDGKFLRVNQRFCDITGYTMEEMLKLSFQDITHPEDLEADLNNVQSLLDGKIKTYAIEKRYYRKDSSIIWVNLTVSLVRKPSGEPYYFLGVIEDITERKQTEELIKSALAEKEVLLKEVHHRVKNNLQVIATLLDFQSELVDDPGTKAVFHESQNRIQSIAGVHEHLYQSETLSQVNMAAYVNDLVADLRQSYGDQAIDIRIEAAEIMLDIETAMPCGLLLNELVSNALKYAFPHGEHGILCVGLHPFNGQIVLVVSDNGVGLPANLDFNDPKTLGMRLISMLTRQLEGEFSVTQAQSGGTTFTVTFPAPSARRH